MSDISLDPYKGKKTALVLSGGVVKAAAWHLGVAWALSDLGFSFKTQHSETEKPFEISTLVGSSAGAMIGVYLAAGFSPLEVVYSILNPKKSKFKSIGYKDILHWRKMAKIPKLKNRHHPFEGFPPMLKQMLSPLTMMSGFFSTEGIASYLKEHILYSNNFEDFAADLFIVATQLDHSRKVIFSKYNYPNPNHDNTATYYTGTPIAEAAAASMAVPPVFSPYPIYNEHRNQTDYYIDGEIRETLSTHVALDNKCDLIISSWTHTPYHFNEEIGSLVNYGLPAITLQSIHLLIQKKIIASRARRTQAIDAINTVYDYLKSEKFSDQQIKTLMGVLERKLNVNRNAKLIDICPDHRDYKVFFGNTFSLDPKSSQYTVKKGYKKTMEVFRNLS